MADAPPPTEAITVDGGLRLDVESLRVLATVVEAGGFTDAAERLGVTQSAVSHKIRRLEERVGMALLHRGGSTVEPTEDGRDLLGYAEVMIAAHDTAVDRIRRRTDVTGRVRLGCNEEVAVTELAEIASRFRRTHPAVELEIRVNDSAVVAEWLDDGSVDLALLQVIETPGRVRLGDEVRRHDRLDVVQATTATFDDAESIPLISFGPRCLYEPFLVRALDAAGRRWHRVLECPSIAGVRSAVTAGLGVAVLNEPHIDDSMRAWTGTVVELPRVAYVLRSGPAEAEPTTALRAHLRQSLEGAAA